MKIALCQINPTVGSFSSNIDLIERTYNVALKKGADLVVFPEMCITGYPPQDLLWKKDFITKSYQSLEKLSKKCTLPMIVGYVRGEGNRLFNSAALCQDGKICDNYDKILLPTYDVFDESRYFSATGLPILYCNLVGAQDELIFDGCSVAFDEKGNCIGQAVPFREDILLIDLNDKKRININYKSRNENVFDALCLGIKDYFVKTGHSDAVVGLSGGIDSAVVASLACVALGSKHVHGISMPSKFSSKHSKEDAEQLAINLGIDFKSISIQDAVNTMENTLLPEFKDIERNTAEENIQARVRGNILMALSNKFGWLVLSTGNKTELALGYCTLYGDMSGGLSVISDLNKTDVYSLANWINESRSNVIPLNTITKPPSAELAPGQVDPFDYGIISPLVDAIIEQNLTIKELTDNGYEEEVVNEVYAKIIKNEYKRRQAPIGIRISNKAFGMGRRFPIVNQYREKNK